MTFGLKDWRTPAVFLLLALVCLVPFNYLRPGLLIIRSTPIPIGRMIFFPFGAVLLLAGAASMADRRSAGGFNLWLAALAVPLVLSSFGVEYRALAFSTCAGFVFRCVSIGWTAYEIGRSEEGFQRFFPLAALLGACVAISGLYEVLTGRWFFIERVISDSQVATELWRPNLRVAAGPIGQPLPLSAVLNLLLPFAFWQWKRTKKMIWLVPVIVISAGVLATFRRSACAVLICMLIAAVWRFSEYRRRIVVGACVFVLSAIALPTVRQHLSDRFSSSRAIRELEDGHRGRVYQVTWNILREHPVLGIGTRQYERTSGRYATYQGSVNTQDSQYLRMAAENGLVGLAILVGFIVYLLITLARSRSPDGWPFLVACAAFAFVLLVLDGFYWPAPAMVFFAIAGVGCGAADRHAVIGRDAIKGRF